MKTLDFDFKGETVTTFMKDDEIFFSAPSVCKILGINNTSQALKNNCEYGGIITNDTLTKGGIQTITIIQYATKREIN
jgi:prophage antirepressor-like protein